ncbi:MAG: IS66 family transposase [Nitrococcus sp.]|nr:IS66 family transposase [Nitrococcus sp.]
MSTATLEHENLRLTEEVNSLRTQLAEAKQQLAWFKRQLFGRKSEKLRPIEGSGQGELLAGLTEAPQSPAPPPTETITYQRSKKRREQAVNDTGLRFDETVPVQVIEVAAPELQGEGAEHYEVISTKSTFRLAQRPGSYVVLEYRRPVLKRRESSELISPPAPTNVLEQSLADVSFLAGMLVDKFSYHLPLYRQHQRLAQSGIQLSRGTLTGLAGRAIELLRPIYDAQIEHILASRVLAIDETPIKAGRKAPGQMRQAYFWPVYGQADEIAFYYAPSRAGAHVHAMLGKDFTGTLLSDGYEAYARYASARPEVTHAECWAHCRRYFERALEAEPRAAREALQWIGALYTAEGKIAKLGLEGKAKLTARTRDCEPLVRGFWQWCQAQCQRLDLLPRSPLAKALQYALARVEALQVFLADPEVPIDTNHLERGLRAIPMGRKNWLFCWTEIGAVHVGLIQSLLVTCRLHDVNPHTYLVDVLQRVGQHPASRVIELTPRVWKKLFASNPLRSDVELGGNNVAV